jgi:hypothetical protein
MTLPEPRGDAGTLTTFGSTTSCATSCAVLSRLISRQVSRLVSWASAVIAPVLQAGRRFQGLREIRHLCPHVSR